MSKYKQELKKNTKRNNRLNLLYYVTDLDLVSIADASGVDYIFYDLEIIGKEERQKHLDTRISKNTIDDILNIRRQIKNCKLLVRVNKIHEGSKKEIDRVIQLGADMIMLPYFKTRSEVEVFLDYVNGRVETCLLLETKEAVECLDEILELKGIDRIHIGLNDLSISLGLKFMFVPLANGLVKSIIEIINDRKIPYGIGGVSYIGSGVLSADSIVAEHYYLGSSAVIMSRGFTVETSPVKFKNELISKIELFRKYEDYLLEQKEDFFKENEENMFKKIMEIEKRMENE